MLFSSISFIYWFLPVVLAVYFAVPRGGRNTVLLISSLIFYGWGEPRYLLLMALSIMVGFGVGILMERYPERKKAFLALSVTFSALSLGYFKYADFFIGSFNRAFGLGIPLLRVALPIGISFYTFQILSYTIDVYRGDTRAQRNPVTLGAYISMFPQLIAGPIVRYRDVEAQLKSRSCSIDMAASGAERFVVGLSKKVIIANQLGELAAAYGSAAAPSVLFSWMWAAAFSLQIYFDFSGYSDMAIGLGRILGFEFIENFNYPFVARSATEFWRRWHISLGSWFRDYLYIPMGGNRVSQRRWIFNILVVWLFTGLWHGASWTFALWGLWFAFLLVLEKLFLKRILDKLPVLGHLYLLLAVVLSFAVFASEDISAALTALKALFGGSGLPFASGETLYYLRSYALLLIIAAVGATPLPKLLWQRLGRAKNLLTPVLLGVLLIVCTAYLVDGSFNPFLYFRF